MPRIDLRPVSSLLAYAKWTESEVIWTIPSTKTTGYFAQKTTGGVKLGVVDCEKSPTLSVVSGDNDGFSRQAFDSNDKTWRIIGEFPILASKLGSSGIRFSSVSSTILYPSIFECMGKEVSDEISQGMLTKEARPLYLKKSAPEEKLDSLGLLK